VRGVEIEGWLGLNVAIPHGYFGWAARLFDPTRIHEKASAAPASSTSQSAPSA
jgi:hypothetical protein